MKKLFVLILLSVFVSISYSQYYRLSSLGNLFIAIEDIDNELNLYDFGGNPAWIVEGERINRTWSHLYFSSHSGNYKRLYEPEILNRYGANFVRVQNLGRSGVFKGYATYEVEERKNLYRSLLLYPYDGKAFFVIDTTVGNYRYAGPSVSFDYGFELVRNLFTGIRLKYTLIDGLKDVYTSARTIYRNIEGIWGLAMRMNRNLSIGFSFEFTNSQEKIEAKSEDLYDAEIYFFRGDQYSIKRRSNLVEFKLNDKGYGGYVQSNLTFDKLSFSIRMGYKQIGKYLFIPYGLIEEYEFGYSNFESYTSKFMGRLKVSKLLTIGSFFQYEYVNTWSKHSERNLLLWHGKFKFIKGGIGTWLKMRERSPAVGFEVIYRLSTIDSLKYIDNKFTNINGFDYQLKGGIEYVLSEKITLRVGAGYRFFNKDILTGYGGGSRYYELTSGVDVLQKYVLIMSFWKFKNNIFGGFAGNDFGVYRSRNGFTISFVVKLI